MRIYINHKSVDTATNEDDVVNYSPDLIYFIKLTSFASITIFN